MKQEQSQATSLGRRLSTLVRRSFSRGNPTKNRGFNIIEPSKLDTGLATVNETAETEETSFPFERVFGVDPHRSPSLASDTTSNGSASSSESNSDEERLQFKQLPLIPVGQVLSHPPMQRRVYYCHPTPARTTSYTLSGYRVGRRQSDASVPLPPMVNLEQRSTSIVLGDMRRRGPLRVINM